MTFCHDHFKLVSLFLCDIHYPIYYFKWAGDFHNLHALELNATPLLLLIIAGDV
jgi:hypothetical protein